MGSEYVIRDLNAEGAEERHTENRRVNTNRKKETVRYDTRSKTD